MAKNNNFITFTFKIISQSGKTLPEVKVVTSPEEKTLKFNDGESFVDFDNFDYTGMTLDFFSKTEDDTIVDENGEIQEDTQFRIAEIWANGIKLEKWFLNDAVYKPNYFEGFLEQFPESESEIKSPYQFNFPGIINWEWEGDFWDWYFEEKNNREVINFLDKDQDRVWKFRGTLDPCDDIIKKLKELLDL